MSFPNSVNYGWPAGFPGAWATGNPRRLKVAGPNGFRAGVGGVTVAAFAWVQTDGVSVLNTGTGAPDGFVCRSQQGVFTQYLQEASMSVPEGFMLALAEGGDVFALSTTQATSGQAVYAALATGAISTGAAGAAPTGTVETGWVVARGGAAGSPIILSGPLSATTSGN
ncbi:hypothetical protein OQ496_12650 [Acetobacter suratthaniensis]|uniref:Uncharacterized protein n=1 Tax=Acetobacter suratthaniensis TaxID=1502841 RepID=A0ABS3LPG5_9PROT|nr:hypothetical protein [Acetobacter suratthaniensis]MBO1329253.1 hypothetical protein [Acetobacter suratthaniensis]MCX2567301.1 hypothetical protein [Acetobacter suratthaniensis]